MKYVWPLAVTFAVRLMVTWPSEWVMVVSLIRNSPKSMAFWVGTFLLEPVLPKYPSSRSWANSRFWPMSNPF